MDIKNLIETELSYFKPILDSQSKVSDNNLAIWRNETVQQRQKRISLECYDLLKGQVSYGPFKGLKLNKDTWWGKLDLGSMLLGLYEKEILDIISNIKQDEYSNFIDIGAADGYYACGILNSKKINNAICFEQSQKGQEVIHQNWINNGSLGSLTIYGEANLQSLERLSEEDVQNALVLIDIEGFEFELLTAEVLAVLKNCTIIIEIHNWADDFINKYRTLLMNAAKHFKIEPLEAVNRSCFNYPELRHFTDDNRALLISERRPCLMRFIKLTPL